MRIYIEISTDPYDKLRPFGDQKAAYIASPFEAKDLIKELPVRRWDKERRRWVVPETDVNVAAAKLRANGYTVEIIGQQEKTKEEPKAGRRGQAQTWADQLYTELPERFHSPVHAALTKILHPDIGGDLEHMQQLNIARDRKRRAA